MAFDATFFTGFASIMLIDLLLSGDNAVVIAMAVRGLKPEQRRTGIYLGAGAAIVMRIILTFFVAQLLNISFVKLVGGVLIFWIGIKLLAEGAAQDEEGISASGSIWGAIKVIMIADATMSLDNMLAVAAASKGNLLLLGIGLLASILFVVTTSNILSKLMDRFPIIVVIGGAILGKIGAEMVLTDPVVASRLHPSHTTIYVAEAVGALVVVIVGKLWAKRMAATARSAKSAAVKAAETPTTSTP
jgi:YjbE family integral membrane protein